MHFLYPHAMTKVFLRTGVVEEESRFGQSFEITRIDDSSCVHQHLSVLWVHSIELLLKAIEFQVWCA